MTRIFLAAAMFLAMCAVTISAVATDASGTDLTHAVSAFAEQITTR